MKNLKEVGKRLYSKNLIHILVVLTIIGLAFYITTTSLNNAENERGKYEAYKAQQEQVIEEYNLKLDSIKEINDSLMREQIRIDDKIDSISQEQKIINEGYEKEINIIRDATLSEHAQWFSTKIDSLRHDYRPDDE